jgi:hypothetical protein
MKNNYTYGIVMVLIVCVLAFPALADVEDLTITSISLINQDPDPAIAGNIVELRIGIENRGGEPAENIVLEVNPKYPFEMVPGENPVEEIGTIKSYQEGADIKIIKYKLRVDRDANAGEYELELFQYEKGKRDQVRTTRTVNVDVKNKESAEVIYIDKVELIPGKQTTMQFTINNVGSAPLRDMTFSWENEDEIILPVGSDDTKYIKYIDINDKAELVYDVIADSNADPGLYKLKLKLSYEDPITGEENEILTNAGVYVGGGTDFDVAYAESSRGETSFSIANIGSNPSYSVSIQIPKQEGWIIKGSNSVIIGNLNKGDYTVAGFKLQPVSNTGEEITLLIKVDYTDTTGKRDSYEKELDLVASKHFGYNELDIASRNSKEGGLFGFSTTTIVIIVLIAVVIFVYIKFHHKKKKAK